MFHLFVQLLPLLSPSGPSLRARSATIEEKKVAVFLSVVLVFPFASFVKSKGFILFAHFSAASLTVRTEP